MNLDREAMRGLGKVTGFGFTVAAAMFIFGWAGLYLDGLLGTKPVFTILLFLSGGGVALWYGIINILK